MRDPRDLYRFESTEVLEAVPRTGLTLVHALPGMVDAGNACRIAATYLRDELRHLRLVSFETDELIDYRGARPHATFDGTSFTEVEAPELTLSLMYDERDRPFLFLDGPEPDLQWRRLTEAMIDLVEYFEVENVVGMQAVPMAVPHTRPIGLFTHANDPSLLGRPNVAATPAPGTSPEAGEGESTELVIPATFSALLEHRLGRAGHPAMGYAAQVPHYLARTDFPAGALALLRRVSQAAELDLPLVHLGDLTDAATVALQGTLAQNDEVRQVVEALEEQYDQMSAGEDPAARATTMDLPTAEEIGEHFERFLADHDGDLPDEPPSA
ncbi:proteasome assembly chaperone family protein [Brachybacterium saurashtrense]|uniref:PAC2 family protein n=1 Tax=Brachybacterium saurashtrense TaxID=556288 RepID=A0A345YL20_9MICO|nr:PAC2 family protein [Brachybacterium saurashtrense]AXK44622.1 PAC2 family protein [Brachybacterium saurashtrense]RRR23234.1 PAC2 family protein [Brachybacterium saurashtrense]